jgi:hypothetical protein
VIPRGGGGGTPVEAVASECHVEYGRLGVVSW